MAHAIIRGKNGRRHEVDFGDAPIRVEVHASEQVVEISIEAPEDGVMEHNDTFLSSEKAHMIRLTFECEKLIVEEENWLGVSGMNVNFIGEYRRA